MFKMMRKDFFFLVKICDQREICETQSASHDMRACRVMITNYLSRELPRYHSVTAENLTFDVGIFFLLLTGGQ